jgi:hypothetical protein
MAIGTYLDSFPFNIDTGVPGSPSLQAFQARVVLRASSNNLDHCRFDISSARANHAEQLLWLGGAAVGNHGLAKGDLLIEDSEEWCLDGIVMGSGLAERKGPNQSRPVTRWCLQNAPPDNRNPDRAVTRR